MGFFLVFFARYWGFGICLGCLGLEGSQISSEKREKKRSKKAQQGHIEHVCKNPGSYLSSDMEIWTFFCAVKCNDHDLASELLGFGACSISGLKLDLILVL